MDTEKNIVVLFYRQANGKEPVRDWLKELSRDERLIIGSDIKTVEFGWPVGLPVCRSLGNELWEVRSNLKNRIARVIFYISEAICICCTALLKSSRKLRQRTWKQL